ncbi:hypothetical protein HK102_013039 [Quaeritorhiza haematococci]|nr:hypothetical protein HK102_013039 [Quaeritorhiza haematococci]
MSTAAEDHKIREARETLDILHELSVLLNTGLDRETLSICVSLCENGVNPEALAQVIKELKREAKAVGGGVEQQQVQEKK